jgi:hypothetical protein
MRGGTGRRSGLPGRITGATRGSGLPTWDFRRLLGASGKRGTSGGLRASGKRGMPALRGMPGLGGKPRGKAAQARKRIASRFC